jgi:hypothetical protein
LEGLKHDGHGDVVAVNKGDIVICVAVAGIEGEFSEGNRYVALFYLSV